ncbi:estradiol 17beta-dehydrogenase [Exophiala aquamarina CBS 119918]|uniref:Estradiol 17beta-dehydrogenase n=1 Tax=Exophiala aquamarina CBS 119918 TaxID=1182545 RepID=A0A072NXZ5_9EURO|nr:estradiol 17beta-dehydrogenase [Exophiala aquamarina CBS 119918]KEF51908.1 estradiol 17beta-dehydrogenase [Exophiala aquamarina CBS 119918]
MSTSSPQVILITGASTGFGALAARLLAECGHIVYAGVRAHEITEIAAARDFATQHKIALRTVLLDITDEQIVNSAVNQVLRDLEAEKKPKTIDIVIHNAGHGSIGPAEAWRPEEMMKYFDINVLGAQRLNRAVLPHMRKAGKGLLIWTSSSSTRGGTPPFLGPYFASKAAMDSLAVTYAGELTKWGIETSIIVPGAFPRGTKHFENLGKPRDETGIEKQYMDGPYNGVPERVVAGLMAITPEDADPADVARAMVRVVNLPHGKRPFRVHVDPIDDGAEVVNGVADRIRGEFLRRIGLDDTLRPKI